MKYLVTLLLFACSLSTYAQSDSTEIKLQQYKELFTKGLISTQEYEALKGRVLGLKQETPQPEKKKKSYYDGKVIFSTRISPVMYFDFSNRTAYPSIGARPNLLQKMGGLHIQAGPEINKVFTPSLLLGFEAEKYTTYMPLGVDFNINFMTKKVSPVAHVTIGNLFAVGGNFANKDAFFTTLGMGCKVRIVKHFTMGLSADYRFLYSSYPYNLTDELGQTIARSTARTYRHQIGVRVSFVLF